MYIILHHINWCGQKSQFPTIFLDRPPALEERQTGNIITDHLACMRVAQKAFIKAKSSERIKLVIQHSIRPSSKYKFLVGYSVYYKRNNIRKWKSLGRVIGQDSTNVLIKHGSTYVRVDWCRTMPDRNIIMSWMRSRRIDLQKMNILHMDWAITTVKMKLKDLQWKTLAPT